MGVAINFDGALGAVRGDSTYLIDATLRLQGLLPQLPKPQRKEQLPKVLQGLQPRALLPKVQLQLLQQLPIRHLQWVLLK